MGVVKLVVRDEIAQALERLPAERRSEIEAQLMSHLSDLVGSARESRAERARRIAAMTPKGVVQTDSVVLVREDRDR